MLIPQFLVWLLAKFLAVLSIHPPETEPIHNLSQCIILVVEFYRSCYIEHDLRVGTHVQCVQGAWNLGHIVAWLAYPVVPKNSLGSGSIQCMKVTLTRDIPNFPGQCMHGPLLCAYACRVRHVALS